jgi:dolichol-phosphate mannosyltransferase
LRHNSCGRSARAGLRVREIPITLVYVDPSRHFRGGLDDPRRRLRHYLDVLDRELVAWAAKKGACTEVA